MDLDDLVFIDATGYHFADYPTFLAWRTAQYQAIYGSDVYLDPSSQDGQLLAVQALSDYQTAALGAAVYSSFSPSTAQGTGLSRNVKINGLSRDIATNSTVNVAIGGTFGTSITNGVVQDSLQQLWNLPASVVIPMGGTITVTATAQDVGAIQAQAGTVTGIYTPTIGWQTVTNAAEATPGAPVETDADLRIRQTISVANPSLTVLEGSDGAVGNLPGVQYVYTYENDTGAPDGNSIPAHNVSTVTFGGDSMEIAQTIALHKTPGVGTYGTTSELVYDTHGMPLEINFFIATQVVIDVQVTITPNAQYSSAYATLIQTAVANYINGLGIGADVIITELYVPAYLVGTPAGQSFSIDSILISIAPAAVGASNIAIAFNAIAQCVALTNVTIVT